MFGIRLLCLMVIIIGSLAYLVYPVNEKLAYYICVFDFAMLLITLGIIIKAKK
jgi:hypothetical protein